MHTFLLKLVYNKQIDRDLKKWDLKLEKVSLLKTEIKRHLTKTFCLIFYKSK